jgi:hypothetical protein
MLSPGYTTLDDFGVGGDDTQHSQIPYYESPVYVQENVSVSVTENQLPRPYDIVFIDHLEKYAKPSLDCINKNKYQVETEYYVNKESTVRRFSVCTHNSTGISRWKTAQLRDSLDDKVSH